jgi:hypothetical protein
MFEGVTLGRISIDSTRPAAAIPHGPLIRPEADVATHVRPRPGNLIGFVVANSVAYQARHAGRLT